MDVYLPKHPHWQMGDLWRQVTQNRCPEKPFMIVNSSNMMESDFVLGAMSPQRARQAQAPVSVIIS